MKKWIIIIVVGLSGCNGGVVDRLLKGASPYENYLSSLESSPLADYALVRDWKAVGENVLYDSLDISLPYQEIGYFDPRQPQAMFLRYPVSEGHQINVLLDQVSQQDARFFIDVFEHDPIDQNLTRIHFADSLGSREPWLFPSQAWKHKISQASGETPGMGMPESTKGWMCLRSGGLRLWLPLLEGSAG